MIVDYGNKLAQDLVEENNSKEVRGFPAELIRSARKKLNMIHAAINVEDLRFPPGNRLEKLKGNLSEFYSIRINDQYRVRFIFKDSNAYTVYVEDYH